MDAVVFALGDHRYAAQMSQVAEVLALGPITPVPAAPAELVGAINVRGRVVPVLDLGLVLAGRPSSPQPGEESLLLRTDAHEAVAYVGRIQQVCRLERAGGEALDMAWPAIDPEGQPVQLLDLERLLQRVADRVARVAARMQVTPLEPADARGAG